MTTKLEQTMVLVNFSDILEVILKMKCKSRDCGTKRRRGYGKKYLRICNPLCFPVFMCAFVRRPT